jgi:hypothetical protein
MKKILVVACLLVLLCGVVSAQEVKVSAPASASSTFTVDIKVSGATNVKGYAFILKFDSALLTADKMEEGSFLKNSGDTLPYPGNSNVPGQITFGASLPKGKTASGEEGTLATITFTPKATGTVTLTLDKVTEVADILPGVLMGANDVISNVKLTDGTVSITGVSAPPATTGTPTTAATTTSAATTATAATTGIAGVPTKSPFIESVFVVALLVGMAFVLKSARKR